MAALARLLDYRGVVTRGYLVQETVGHPRVCPNLYDDVERTGDRVDQMMELAASDPSDGPHVGRTEHSRTRKSHSLSSPRPGKRLQRGCSPVCEHRPASRISCLQARHCSPTLLVRCRT